MMGGGDVKMIGALALWFPFSVFSQLLVTMSLVGGAIAGALRGRPHLVRRCFGSALGVAVLVPFVPPVQAAPLSGASAARR